MEQAPETANPGRVLLAVASELEAKAVAGEAALPELWRAAPINNSTSIVITGVGKANAAAAIARAVATEPPAAVISLGIAGALPTPDAPAIGDAVLATASVFADEGIRTPGGFQTCREMGFPLGPGESDSFAPDAALEARVLSALSAPRRGVIATVSTCSGTNAAAAEVTGRTGAIAEAMEGAAVALACARLGVPFAELRVISNTTGDRDAQRWDMSRALAALNVAAAALI